MKLDIFLQKTANLSLENRILKLIVIVIGIVVLINTVMIYSALHSHRTILIPPVINSRIDSGIKTYIIEYRIENGRFMIQKITEKKV